MYIIIYINYIYAKYYVDIYKYFIDTVIPFYCIDTIREN